MNEVMVFCTSNQLSILFEELQFRFRAFKYSCCYSSHSFDVILFSEFFCVFFQIKAFLIIDNCVLILVVSIFSFLAWSIHGQIGDAFGFGTKVFRALNELQLRVNSFIESHFMNDISNTGVIVCVCVIGTTEFILKQLKQFHYSNQNITWILTETVSPIVFYTQQIVFF